MGDGQLYMPCGGLELHIDVNDYNNNPYIACEEPRAQRYTATQLHRSLGH